MDMIEVSLTQEVAAGTGFKRQYTIMSDKQ